jgi:hypothetical protein
LFLSSAAFPPALNNAIISNVIQKAKQLSIVGMRKELVVLVQTAKIAFNYIGAIKVYGTVYL